MSILVLIVVLELEFLVQSHAIRDKYQIGKQRGEGLVVRVISRIAGCRA